jgi:hypothetical protein
MTARRCSVTSAPRVRSRSARRVKGPSFAFASGYAHLAHEARPGVTIGRESLGCPGPPPIADLGVALAAAQAPPAKLAARPAAQARKCCDRSFDVEREKAPGRRQAEPLAASGLHRSQRVLNLDHPAIGVEEPRGSCFLGRARSGRGSRAGPSHSIDPLGLDLILEAGGVSAQGARSTIGLALTRSGDARRGGSRPNQGTPTTPAPPWPAGSHFRMTR